MIHQMSNAPEGVTGLAVAGTVLKRDVTEALRVLPAGAPVLAVVDPEFDGYMAELIAGLSDGIADGQMPKAALVVPDGMRGEAAGHNRNEALGVFGAAERELAENWLTG